MTHSGTSLAVCTRREARWQTQGRVEHHAHRRTFLHAGQPARQQRIVGQCSADSDHDRIALRPQEMHTIARLHPGDGNRRPACRPSFAIRRDRELEHDVGTAVAHAPDVSGMVVARFLGAGVNIDDNASRTKPRVALAGHFRIGIFDRRDDARQACSDDGVGAGRRFAVMRARLQRHVERRTTCRCSGAPQRLDLGMRPAAGLRPAAAHNHAVLHDHGANGRVWPRPAKPAPSEGQRQSHEPGVIALRQCRPQ